MKPRTVSVIIPSYNEEQNIARCLDTLLTQTKKADEIFVVDDGSTDKTSEIVSRYPVKLLKSTHDGPGVSRNLGAAKSSGDILIFVDADMTFDPNFLKNLIEPIISGKAKGVFNGREYVANFDNPLARCWNLNNGLLGKERMDSSSVEDTEDFRAILKSEFERVGGFDNTGYTDSRTLVKKLGYRPKMEKGAVSYHANPESYSEIYVQARWIGKRKTKYGISGKIFNLLKYSFPVSLCLGIYKSLVFSCPQFVTFKIVYDFGYSVGTFVSLFSSNLNK